MSTQIQITNRNALTRKRVTASLQDADTGDTVLDFVIGPGEAVIVPMMKTMNLVVSCDQPGGEVKIERLDDRTETRHLRAN